MENIGVKIIYFFMEGCGWCKKFLPEWNLLKQKIDSNELKGLKHYEFERSELKINERAIRIQRHVEIEGFPTIIIKIGDKYCKYDRERTVYDIVNFIKDKIKENAKLQLEVIDILEEKIIELKQERTTVRQSGGKKINYKKKYHKYKELYFGGLKK
jgi:hypothetical protein